MIELLGYTYFEHERKVKTNKKTGTDFFVYLQKEQEIYLAGAALNNRMDEPFFNYLYAQTFIDLAIYLQEFGDLVDLKGISLANGIAVRTAKQAYEQALKILVGFEKPTGHVHGSLSFVYEQLGMRQKSVEEKKMQGMAVKDSIYELLRRPIRDKLVGQVIVKTFFVESVQKRYIKLFGMHYMGEDRTKVQRTVDSLTYTTSIIVARSLISRNPQASALTDGNKELLQEDLQKVVYKKVDDTLSILELSYIKNIVLNLSSEKRYKDAINQLDRYTGLFEKNDVYDEWLMMKNRLTEEYIKYQPAKKTATTSSKETAVAVTYWDTQDTVSSSLREESRTARKREKREKGSDIVVVPQEQKNISPVFENVSMLIDNLIRNKDYVSAYRGIKAYERVLKENYGAPEVTTKITNLERLIIKEYGEDYFKILRQEMKK
jgi:hypothetical protein